MQEPDVEDDTAIHTITYSLKFCVVWSVIVFFSVILNLITNTLHLCIWMEVFLVHKQDHIM